ncbi:hypothetical protein SAMN04489740_1380 [Arthrobacter alpinus]|uniref:Uncharacterized protein n=1 Tax=Arthrobacter alpinus TaxID=656366 RepID=A0A1H5IRY7_9MICC|nr:hypothetical protein [Arthrobacter alpinus]SEE42621.1 hypothetical protein SAMN04489740_1380 [Arthrobacter alpinus]
MTGPGPSAIRRQGAGAILWSLLAVLSIVLKVRGLFISTFILFVRDPVFYEETRVGDQHILAAIAALPTAAARIAGGLVDRGDRRIR